MRAHDDALRPLRYGAEARDLLVEHGLPTGDLPSDRVAFYELIRNDERIGIGAIQEAGEDALLRSVVILRDHRGRAHGRDMVGGLIARARTNSLRALYLLTTTAEGFFDKCGFRVVDRGTVPREIRETAEFRDLCPDDAVVMKRSIT